MKEIKAATDTEYGVLNMTVSGYDMTLVEHYAQYVHKLCNQLDIKVNERYHFNKRYAKSWVNIALILRSTRWLAKDIKKKCFLRDNQFCLSVFWSYALPTKSTEIMVMPEQGTKMYVDAILKTHERVVQVNAKT